jgi:hypothetical protein
MSEALARRKAAAADSGSQRAETAPRVAVVDDRDPSDLLDVGGPVEVGDQPNERDDVPGPLTDSGSRCARATEAAPPVEVVDDGEPVGVVDDEAEAPDGPGRPARPTRIDDDQAIIDRARRAKNGDKFAKLFDQADESDYYGIAAPTDELDSADLALCNILAFYTLDPDQIERLMLESALGQRIGHSIKKTRWIKSDYEWYRERTIRTALDTRKQSDKDMARQLAETDGDKEVWDVMFTLVRRLKLRGEDWDYFGEVVKVFCEAADKPYDEYFNAFVRKYDKVETAEGETVLDWAANRAKAHPVTPKPCFTSSYQMVASIAYHLSNIQGEHPFWLPGDRIAEIMGTNKMNVSRIIQNLQSRGVIKCVNQDWEWRQGRKRKCKEYVYTGPGLS